MMMSGSNPTHSLLLCLIFFSALSFQLSFCIGNNAILCPEIEKQSLLSFKQSLKDPNNELSSWDGTTLNCCEWKGVICDNLTGQVHQLHLQNAHPLDGFQGKINPSLLNLKYLTYLDLSGNDFYGETIPSFIGSLANLQYLNLSRSSFHGQVPHTLGNLSNLHTLDLSGYVSDCIGYVLDSIRYRPYGLVVDSLEWARGLSQLEYLNMNKVDLSKAANTWAQVITSLPSLIELHCEHCRLGYMASPNITTSLKHLYLSCNHLSSVSIPWIFQFNNLLSLDLSVNYLEGPIPTISNATKLQYIGLDTNNFNSSIPNWFSLCKDLEFLYLSGNQLSGKIPKEISKLCKLKSLHLSHNNLEGDISDSFGDMSDCFLEALEILDLSYNKLSGHLTNQFGEFKSIQTLNLGENSIHGVIPANIGKLSFLEYFSLVNNKFTGTLPESLGQLLNLRELDLDHNMLEGVVTETHFANLTKLEFLLAFGNHLTLKVSPNWNPSFQLTILQLGSWNLGAGSNILSWLEKQKNIKKLHLSNTGISGNVPSWCGNISTLDLSHNNLHGEIPYLFGNSYVDLSSNQFSGTLPRIGDIVTDLYLSNNSLSGGISHLLCDNTYETYGLEILSLGGNQLGGELPADCWIKWPSLTYLDLNKNNLFGSIPNSIGYLASLRSLKLYGNRLSGNIPFSMHNCTYLRMIDVADNDLDGGVPAWMGTYLVLRFLILRSNKLSGDIPSEMCRLKFLQILDLSDNNFSGKIPRCLYNFTAMTTKFRFFSTSLVDRASVIIKGRELEYGSTLGLVTDINLSKNKLSGDIPKGLTSLVELRSLNLSQNRLTGSIPDNIGDMKQLESLDFSRNELSGLIPNSFKLLSFLGHLNLSHNELTGRIPESTQIRGFDASGFSGNNLCGPPLTITCSGDGDGQKEENEDEEEEEEGGDESKIDWLYVLVSLGYAVGFSAVCSALVLNKSWREAYFGLLERIWDELYVYVHIKWNKLTKPSHPTS